MPIDWKTPPEATKEQLAAVRTFDANHDAVEAEPLVLDGTTGGVLDTIVDGVEARVDTRPAPAEPSQPRLIEVALEDLVHSLNVWERERVAAKARKKAAAADMKYWAEKLEPLVAELQRRDDEVGRPLRADPVDEPLPFDGEEDAEDDDE